MATILLARGLFAGYIYNFPAGLIIFFGAYLIIKALIFNQDIASWLDFVAGALLIASIYFAIPLPILVILAIPLGIKGFMTFFAGSGF